MVASIVQRDWLILSSVAAATFFGCVMYEWSRSWPSWSVVDMKLQKHTGPQPRRAIAAYHALVTGQPMPLSHWEQEERGRRAQAAVTGAPLSVEVPPETGRYR